MDCHGAPQASPIQQDIKQPMHGRASSYSSYPIVSLGVPNPPQNSITKMSSLLTVSSPVPNSIDRELFHNIESLRAKLSILHAKYKKVTELTHLPPIVKEVLETGFSLLDLEQRLHIPAGLSNDPRVKLGVLKMKPQQDEEKIGSALQSRIQTLLRQAFQEAATPSDTNNDKLASILQETKELYDALMGWSLRVVSLSLQLAERSAVYPVQGERSSASDNGSDSIQGRFRNLSTQGNAASSVRSSLNG
ncbi:hypothetical protein CALVIDRAFT_570723 [Calocera viscosa TUFC12733]|uniref:Uncharacterized protein n=1 Tax=Calocera viscosa (strain TUFC12733) TaxID=1330018 RepID=A0A167SC46_CALVF|nr:hypothetical protein CALVIDRAFT_570723 [Calocera viscosa TUFC12733]